MLSSTLFMQSANIIVAFIKVIDKTIKYANTILTSLFISQLFSIILCCILNCLSSCNNYFTNLQVNTTLFINFSMFSFLDFKH